MCVLAFRALLNPSHFAHGNETAPTGARSSFIVFTGSFALPANRLLGELEQLASGLFAVNEPGDRQRGDNEKRQTYPKASGRGLLNGCSGAKADNPTASRKRRNDK